MGSVGPDAHGSAVTFPAELVSGELAHGQLHPQTNACTSAQTHLLPAVAEDDGQAQTAVLTQEGLPLPPGPADGVDLPLRPPDAKTSRDKDAAAGRGGTKACQKGRTPRRRSCWPTDSL